jgi:hypothetical protein
VVNSIQTRAGVTRSIEDHNALRDQIAGEKAVAAPPRETLYDDAIDLASHSRITYHDRVTRNFPAAGFDYRCRGIGYERGSGHRFIDARAGCQGFAKDREVSGHSEGGATLRQLRAV